MAPEIFIDQLKEDIQGLTHLPKGVIVSDGLMELLSAEGEVEEREFKPVGFNDVIMKFPVLKGTFIVVHVSKKFTGFTYELPRKSMKFWSQ